MQLHKGVLTNDPQVCVSNSYAAHSTIGPVRAGETVDDAGAIVCVNDKWDEKEVEKGHKLVDAVQRCVIVPNNPDLPLSGARHPGEQ
jgi:hypothetical protein